MHFQPLDLRWGGSVEARRSQETLRTCFEEIARCQQVSPDCNFFIPLGDRYGSRLLPDTIPSAEYAALNMNMSPWARQLLQRW
jgi:hypothetical protein